MRRFWEKRLTNTNRVAQLVGVEEEKIKELKEGKREIKGKTLDNVINKIEEDKVNYQIYKANIYKWIISTDLVNLRKQFGYKTQKDLAKVIGIDNTTISSFEKGKVPKKTTDTVIKYYEFFQNDFNINLNKPSKNVNMKLDEENKEIYKKAIKYFKENSLMEFMSSRRLSRKDIVKELGYKSCGGSQGKTISDLRLHKTPVENYKLVIRLYNYCKQFDNNENNKSLAEIVAEEVKEEIKAEKPIKVRYFDTDITEPKEDSSHIIEDLQKVIEYQNKDIERLKNQIERYEKLIDKIV